VLASRDRKVEPLQPVGQPANIVRLTEPLRLIRRARGRLDVPLAAFSRCPPLVVVFAVRGKLAVNAQEIRVGVHLGVRAHFTAFGYER
jgi:hypothetical protein